MNKKLRWIIFILLGLIVILLILKKAGIFATEEGIKVTTEKVTRKQINEVVTANGKVFPELEVKVSSDISGEIIELKCKEGDSVKKGQVLARIYADIYNTQRDQAAAEVNRVQAGVDNSSAALDAFKARLEQAKTNYDRQKSLLDEKVISPLEFEQADNAYKTTLSEYNAAKQNIRGNQAVVSSARAGLARANKDVSRGNIVAPMDGIISLLAVKRGEKVVGTAQMAGTEMMRIADMSSMEVRVEVGENDIPKVHLGDSAKVSIDAYGNRKFAGVVTKIAASNTNASSGSTGLTSANEATSYLVNIQIQRNSYQDLFNNTSTHALPFRPGMNATADIYTTTHNNVLTVPINAVTTRDDNPDQQSLTTNNKVADQNNTTKVNNDLNEVVFVLQKDQTVKPVIVKTAIQDMNYIEIIAGLKEGDEVVVGPYNVVSKQLKKDTKVKVVSKDKLFEKE